MNPTGSYDRPEGLAAKITAALDRLARARRLQRQSDATLHGVTPLQLDLLTILAEGPPPEPTVGLLATEVAVTQPTATDSLQALVSKGLVERRRDPTDRRRSWIELTAAGQELVGDLSRTDDDLTAAVASLPQPVQEATLEALLTLIARLVETGAIQTARTCLTCRYHQHDGRMHHCTLLGIDLPPADLRVNCPEHHAA